MSGKMPLIKPKHLSRGDTIGIIVPSEPICETEFDAGVEFLRQEGFRVALGRYVRARDGHLAGSDEQRALDFNEFFADPSVRAVFCGAGGANSARLLPLIDYDTVRLNPKLLLGLSDPTALLCAVHRMTGLVTFHGPVVQYNFSKPMSSFTSKYFWRAICSDKPIGQIIEVNEHNILRHGATSGPLIGGNLTTLQQLIGTPYEPLWDGAILFWEDVAEQTHVLDAKLTHLRNAGIFEQLSGMIIGTLESCDEQDYDGVPAIEEIVLDLCSGYSFPILKNVDLGHTKDKMTIPIGVTASIDTDGVVFSIGEGGVS